MRTFPRIAVLLYLFITASAFVFTLTRLRPPFLPYRILTFSYGMMAPYQRDSDWNYAITAEGLVPGGEGHNAAEGMWEPIDLAPYYPYQRGERVMREHLLSFASFGDDVRFEQFTKLAILLLDRERAKGKPYEAVRLWREEWPRSAEGYETLRVAPHLKRIPLTQAR